MERVTVVKTDGYACVDGKCYNGIDMSSLPEDLHAMQWYGSQGEEEYRDPVTRRHTNFIIHSLSPYQAIIDQWNVKDQEAQELVNNPPVVVPYVITRRQCAKQLLIMGLITDSEALEMTRSGIPPASVQQYINMLPESDRVLAEIDFAANEYLRDNPLLTAMMIAAGKTDEEVDQFFIAAEAL